MNQQVKPDDIMVAKRQMELYGIPAYTYKAWREQRHSSLKRGIPFNFTLLAWHCWWNAELVVLGPDARRGKRRGEYVMARHGDTGAYEHGNVYAATPAQNAADIREDVRIVMTERATETRNANGNPRGQHLAIRGDGHPKAHAVITPIGRFGSIALAADAYGITRAGGHYRLKRGEWTRAEG